MQCDSQMLFQSPHRATLCCHSDMMEAIPAIQFWGEGGNHKRFTANMGYRNTPRAHTPVLLFGGLSFTLGVFHLTQGLQPIDMFLHLSMLNHNGCPHHHPNCFCPSKALVISPFLWLPLQHFCPFSKPADSLCCSSSFLRLKREWDVTSRMLL